ncbi:MAG: DUF2079 domain-containing protein [Leptolyngbya sp. SIO1E4]|nr:DUF2079 domain-containing protein [Leptolyngbya sp. SIO1E4]
MRLLRSFTAHRTLVILASLFWGLMVISILNRHFAMYPSFSSHDQGIFNQVFWNGAHGRLFESTLSSGESAAVQFENQLPDVTYRRLGQHFTPIHLLWLPLYTLLPFSATLLVLQVTLVTAGGIALYFLARQRLSEQVATWITLSYYCATAVIAPNLANFHDFSQIPLFVFLMLLAIERKQWGWAISGTLLVLLCREDTGIILFSIGLYFLVSRRYPRIGAGLCVVSVGHLLLTTNVLMPLFSEEVGTNFLAISYAPYVEGDDASTLTLLLGILSRPDRVLIDLVTPVSRTVRFLTGHWLPLLFVPAISPMTWLNVFAPLTALLLRQDSHLALSMQLRYTVMVVPGLFYGTILWWASRPPKLSTRTRRIWSACLCLSLFFTFTLNPVRTWSFVIPDSVDPWVHLSLPRQWQHAGEVRSLLTQIPPDASVSATDHLLPHISGRRAAIRFPGLEFQNDDRETTSVDYIIADLWQLQQYQVAFSGSRRELQERMPFIQSLIDENRYGLVAATEGVFLLHQGQTSVPEALSAWQDFQAQLTLEGA